MLFDRRSTKRFLCWSTLFVNTTHLTNNSNDCKQTSDNRFPPVFADCIETNQRPKPSFLALSKCSQLLLPIIAVYLFNFSFPCQQVVGESPPVECIFVFIKIQNRSWISAALFTVHSALFTFIHIFSTNPAGCFSILFFDPGNARVSSFYQRRQTGTDMRHHVKRPMHLNLCCCCNAVRFYPLHSFRSEKKREK